MNKEFLKQEWREFGEFLLTPSGVFAILIVILAIVYTIGMLWDLGKI